MHPSFWNIIASFLSAFITYLVLDFINNKIISKNRRFMKLKLNKFYIVLVSFLLCFLMSFLGLEKYIISYICVGCISGYFSFHFVEL